MKSLFEGVGVALVTPFKNTEIDYRALSKLIERAIAQKADAIVILATTGEGATIKPDERVEMIKFCSRTINGRTKLIVGTGHNDFYTCYLNTHIAKSLGVDGALVVTPYYNKTSKQGLIKFYDELSQIGLPLIVYNVPSRTGLNIPLDTLEKIINTNELIYGIKESTTDISRIQKLCRICHKKVAVYSGEDELNYLFYCLGAQGTISVTANVDCQRVKKVYDSICQGDFPTALKTQNSLSKLNETLFVETNPIPVKALMSKMGLIEDELRLPLVKLSDENILKIENAEKELKMQNFSEKLP